MGLRRSWLYCEGSPSLKLPLSYRRFNIPMYRGVATALVALAAFDYFYPDGKYLHHVQVVADSLLHVFFR